jgi:hypothetical protein
MCGRCEEAHSCVEEGPLHHQKALIADMEKSAQTPFFSLTPPLSELKPILDGISGAAQPSLDKSHRDTIETKALERNVFDLGKESKALSEKSCHVKV